MFDTNRPSSSVSRHITVDLYRTLCTADDCGVDAVWMFTGVVDLITVAESCDISHYLLNCITIAQSLWATSHSYGSRQNSTFFTLWWFDRSLPSLVWLIMSAIHTHANFSRIWLRLEFSTNRRNITPLWLCSVPFSCTRLEQKPVNGSARSMAQNGWNQPRMCPLGVSSKNLSLP